MTAETSAIEFYHSCESCEKRGKRCVPNGAYGACERCQKKRRPCSNMESKRKQPESIVLSRPCQKFGDGESKCEPCNRTARCGSCTCPPLGCRCHGGGNCQPHIRQSTPPSRTSTPRSVQITIEAGIRVRRDVVAPTASTLIESTTSPADHYPPLLSDTVLTKLLSHGALEPDLQTIKSQGYITVPQHLAIPNFNSAHHAQDITTTTTTIKLPLHIYSISAIEFLGFNFGRAASHATAFSHTLSKYHSSGRPIPPNFLASYFSKERLRERPSDSSFPATSMPSDDDRTTCIVAGIRPDIIATLFGASHTHARKMLPIMDWLVDIVRSNARALERLLRTVEENISEKLRPGECVVRRVMPVGSVASMFRDGKVGLRKESEVVRWGAWERDGLSIGRLRARMSPRAVKGKGAERELMVWGEVGEWLERRGDGCEKNRLSFQDCLRYAREYGRLVNEVEWARGKISVEVMFTMKDWEAWVVTG